MIKKINSKFHDRLSLSLSVLSFLTGYLNFPENNVEIQAPPGYQKVSAGMETVVNIKTLVLREWRYLVRMDTGEKLPKH